MLLHNVVAYGVLCNSICFFVPPVLQVCQRASRGRGTVSVPFVWLSISNAQTAKANFMKLVREGGSLAMKDVYSKTLLDTSKCY